RDRARPGLGRAHRRSPGRRHPTDGQPGLPSRRPRPGFEPTGVHPMPPRLAPLKIRAEHLDRQALIYVRQSTPIQVRDNVASTARQYDLARYAERLGWPRERIRVID